MEKFNLENNLHFYIELGLSILLLLIFFITKKILARLIKRHALHNGDNQSRVKYVIKLANFGLILLFLTILALVWEISFKGLSFYFASFFTVAGVALFASWSILSNITAYTIIFFNFPFKIGSRIRIMDGDDSVEGKVDDITLFFLKIKLPSGEVINYPNNVAIQKPIKEFLDTQ